MYVIVAKDCNSEYAKCLIYFIRVYDCFIRVYRFHFLTALRSNGYTALYDTVSDPYAALYGSGSLWIDLFKLFELTQVVRQKDDSIFTSLLNRLRIGECTEEDLKLLKSREITSTQKDYSHNILHVYRTNKDVDERNLLMLNRLCNDTPQYTINAHDTQSENHYFTTINTSAKCTDTGGLHSVLKVGIGAQVMLTVNVDVADGLVNGARGKIVHLVFNGRANELVSVLVSFDDPAVGLNAIQHSTYRNGYPTAVPIQRHKVTFYSKGK